MKASCSSHSPGLLDRTVGTITCRLPACLAMRGEHYPITEIGLANLCRQLIARGGEAIAAIRRQVTVKRYPRADQQPPLHAFGNHVSRRRKEKLGLFGAGLRR